MQHIPGAPLRHMQQQGDQAARAAAAAPPNSLRLCASQQRQQRLQTRSERVRFRTCSAQGVLGIEGLHEPLDCLQHAVATLQQMRSTSSAQPAAADANGTAILNDLQLRKMSVTPAFELLSERHPDPAWRQAAAAAALLLEEQSSRLQDEFLMHQTHLTAASSSSSATDQQQQQQQQRELQQLESWLHDLQDMESAAAAAAVRAVHDPNCSPVLLLDSAAAGQHPVWAAAYSDWQQQQQQQHQQQQQQQCKADQGRVPKPASHQHSGSEGTGGSSSSSSTASKLYVGLPKVDHMEVSDSALIPVAPYYAAAAAAAAAASRSSDLVVIEHFDHRDQMILDNLEPAVADSNIGTAGSSNNNQDHIMHIGEHHTVPTQHSARSNPAQERSHAAAAAVDEDGVACHMPYPLTAAASAALLASPLGLLSDDLLSVIYDLGVAARLQVAAAAVDLVWMIRREIRNTQLQLQQLQNLSPGRDVPKSPVTAGSSTYNVSSSSSGSSSSSSSNSAVSHPMIALRFLEELARYSKTAAAEELQSWLSICRQHTTQEQQQQQNLIRHVNDLQPYQVDSMRQMVSVIECERIAAAGRGRRTVGDQLSSSSSSSSSGGSGSSSGGDLDTWLQAYTATEQLLTGACEVIGGLLSTNMTWQVTENNTHWCQDQPSYVIKIHDKLTRGGGSSKRSDGSSSSSGGSGSYLGVVYVLFDGKYDGMPYTTLISQGGYYQTAAAAAVEDVPATTTTSSSSNMQDNFQPCKVAIVFPASYYLGSSSSSTGSSNNSGSSSSSNLTSSSSRLSTLMHELGHALHFILSSTAAAATAADCCCWAHTDLLEIPSHLFERYTRDVRSLQILLRHSVTGQPPSLNLTKQLQTHILISSRGAYQWQQHLLAAVADARLAAAAAVEDNQVSCWEVLMNCQQECDPLTKAGPSTTQLTYITAMAAMPGNLYSYIFAELAAAAIWEKFLQADPLDPAPGLAVRRLLFEATASLGTAGVVEQLLGKGSLVQLKAQSDSSSSSSVDSRVFVTGYVPNLKHAAFQDIDLWG